MVSDAAFSMALAEMRRLADARTVARWLHQLGHRQVALDLSRRDEIALARRLFDGGRSRAEVHQRLAGMGLSRPTIDRRIAAALAQGPRHSEWPAGEHSAIQKQE